MHRHARSLVALTALAGALATAPAASAALHITAPAADVNLRDLQGAPDATPLLRVAGHREPGDATQVRIFLLPMITGTADGLSQALLVRTLNLADAQRSFATTLTRGDLRSAGRCSDPACTATTPADAWLPDPYRVVLTNAVGGERTIARGGIGMPYFQESGDAATTSARIGRAAGGFAEVTADLTGGGVNFAADFRPLPDGGAGAWLGAWYSEGIVEGAEPLAQPAGPGQGFRQTHAVRADGSVALAQRFRLARSAGAGGDAGMILTRALGVSGDGATYTLKDTVRNAASRARTVAITYRLGAYTTIDPIWTLPWLSRRDQRSNGRATLRVPRGPGFLLQRPESAGPYDAAHGWAAWGQRPARMRFANVAFADGTLLVTFRLTIPARSTRSLRLAAGIVGDPAVGRARARLALRAMAR